MIEGLSYSFYLTVGYSALCSMMYAGKYQEMALGKYPSISLSEARKLAEEARASLIHGVNPMDERRERKRTKTTAKNK